MVGLDDLRGLFQPMILWSYVNRYQQDTILWQNKIHRPENKIIIWSTP